MMPRFAEGIPNVTVTVGRDALLACVVENLRGYKVSQLYSYANRTFTLVFETEERKCG